MRGIGNFNAFNWVDELIVAKPEPKRVIKEPNGPALVRLECADGVLIEGRAVEYRIAPPQGDNEPSRIVLTFLAETTTPDWKTLHASGEDMGEPINPDDPELCPSSAPTPPTNPKWGQFA